MHNLFVYKEKLTCVLIITVLVDHFFDFLVQKIMFHVTTAVIRYVGNLQMDYEPCPTLGSDFKLQL